MARRSFLKIVGMILGAISIGLPFPFRGAAAETDAVVYKGKQYKGDHLGRILVSANGGRTWDVHTTLGRIYAVRRLAVSSNQRLYATVGHRSRSFALVLDKDGRMWRTA